VRGFEIISARENQTRRNRGFEPHLRSLTQTVVHLRSIRALHHWPLKPGGMTVYGVVLRLTVDGTVNYATQV